MMMLFIASLTTYAQGVYTHKMTLDRFDEGDYKELKTLITQTDSTFVFEEKGKEPYTYYIINEIIGLRCGKKDSIVNLTGNVYGYEETWSVVKENDMEEYVETYWDFIRKSHMFVDDEEMFKNNLMNMCAKYWRFVTHRVITDKYGYRKESDYIWIQDDNTGERIIYSREY